MLWDSGAEAVGQQVSSYYLPTSLSSQCLSGAFRCLQCSLEDYQSVLYCNTRNILATKRCYCTSYIVPTYISGSTVHMGSILLHTHGESIDDILKLIQT